MIAILKHGTTAEQTDHLIAWLKRMNLDVHISEGTEVTVLGLIGDTSRVDMELLNSLEQETPGLFGNIFHSIEHVNLQTILGYQERTDAPIIRVTDGAAGLESDEI